MTMDCITSREEYGLYKKQKEVYILIMSALVLSNR